MRYASNVGAATLVDITGGNAQTGTYLLNLVNRTDAPIKVRVAVTAPGQNPQLADYLEYDASIEANDTLSRWPLPIEAGERVFVYAATAGISATLIGRPEA